MPEEKLTRGAMSVAAAALLFLAFAAPAEAQRSSAEDVQEGAGVYGATCGRCHYARSPLEHSDRDWVLIINHMRVRANLTGKQTRSVLAFLQATNAGPQGPEALPSRREAPSEVQPSLRHEPVSEDPEVIARGKELIAVKACNGCHVLEGTGGNLGPSLDGALTRRDAQYVWEKLTNPAFDNATSMMPNLGLTQDEIEALVAYLATLE